MWRVRRMAVALDPEMAAIRASPAAMAVWKAPHRKILEIAPVPAWASELERTAIREGPVAMAARRMLICRILGVPVATVLPMMGPLVTLRGLRAM
uniref:SET104 n=1 Tax=Arundo donax TaxID=35708 RepID=A0A0A9DSI7_ARUDO